MTLWKRGRRRHGYTRLSILPRMELTRLKKKLVTATRGHKLLKDKRDELMRQFLDMARENMALREKVEAGIKAANTNFVIAKAGMTEQILQYGAHGTEAGGAHRLPASDQECNECRHSGVRLYRRKARMQNDIYSYGFAFTSGELDDAVKSLCGHPSGYAETGGD